MNLYIDLTEFLTNPITTGIQRIAGEICRYSPEGAVIPVRLDLDRYVALPPALIGMVGNYFRDPSPRGAAEIRNLGTLDSGSAVHLSPQDSVLVPEAFIDLERLAFFREMSEQELQRCRFIIYDLLPATHPEYFPPEMTLAISAYFQLIRKLNCCGFISEYTRDIYYRRLKRTHPGDGVVLPLGCDSLGARANRSALNRPLTFTVLGTIEPRKNHALILEAFEPLLRHIPGLSLSFIGKMGWVDSEFARKVRELAADQRSGFRFQSVSDDQTIRHYVEHSRATIYVSAAEGYGLPPVESLWCGTPVIASTTIPSLSRLGSAGIHYVNPLNVMNLRDAVLAFVDDSYANHKIDETHNLHLPTWQSFTQTVLRWCSQTC